MKRRHVIRTFCIAMLATLATSGCWDATDIGEISAVVGFGVDRVGETEVQVSAQIPVVAGEQSQRSQQGGSQTTKVLTGTGNTLEEAMRDLNLHSSRRLVYSHNQFILYGGDYARQGIQDVVDLFTRDTQFRTTMMHIVTSGRAVDLLQSRAQGEYLNAHFVAELTKERSKPYHQGTQVIDLLMSPSRSAVFPWVDPDEQGRPVLRGRGVIQDYRLVDLWDAEHSMALNWFGSGVKGKYYILTCKQGESSVNVLRARASVRVASQHPLELQVKVRGIAEITNLCHGDHPTTAVFQQMESTLDAQVQAQIQEGIQRLKSVGADPLQFGTEIYREHPALWKTVSSDWTGRLRRSVPVSYDVRLHILRSGLAGADATSNPQPRSPSTEIKGE